MKKILSVLVMLTLLVSFTVIPANAAVKPNAVENAVLWAINTADDDTHGYSQAGDRRWGTPDYDCASFVICAYRSVGFKLSSAVHCGNMKQAFIDEGFEWIPKSKIDLSTSKNLKRGDILLNTTSHTEIYIGDNKQVGAHDGSYDIYDYDDPGDSTGKEICPVTYNNYSNWEGILRYPTEKFVDVGTDFYAHIINNSTKKLLTANENRNVTVEEKGAEIAYQIWKFERQDDGCYIIRNLFDSKVLNVSNSGKTPGTNVSANKNSDSSSKRWFIYGSKDKYRIKTKLVDLTLDIKDGTDRWPDKTNVQLETDDGSSTQLFKIKKLDIPSSTYVESVAGTNLTPTSIWWNVTPYTDVYDLQIYSESVESGELIQEIKDLTETHYQVYLPAGTYEAVVYSRNSIISMKSLNVTTFTILQPGEKLLGDVDLDGNLSVLDATEIQRLLAKINQFTEQQQKLADVDEDGKISVLDATQIQRQLAKLI